MYKTILAAAIATLATSAAVAGQPEQRFERDGHTYLYTSTHHGDRQVIDGRRLPSGSAFHLVVRNGRVTGTSGGTAVAFDVADRAGPVETAAR